MYRKSRPVSPKFHSKLGALIPVVSCFLGLAMAVFVVMFVLEREASHLEKGTLCSFILLLMLFVVALWLGYYKIRIADGQVRLRGIFRQKAFLLDHISGYALHYRSAKGQQVEVLSIGLTDGQFFTFHPQYYRNYPEIKAALTEGKSPDPVVLAKAMKSQKWREFITYTAIVLPGTGMLLFGMDFPGSKVNTDANHLALILGGMFLFWKYGQYAVLPKQ